MKKSLCLLVALFITLSTIAESGFTVTHCNLTRQITSFTDGENALFDSSRWKQAPIISSYKTIAFIHYLEGYRDPHFKSRMVSFPGISAGSRNLYEYCVVEAAGTILIPEAGDWTFACGCDDMSRITISGHGISEIFDAGEGAFITELKTIRFPIAGRYKFRLVYVNVCAEAAVEVSVAKGEFTAFNSHKFHLLGDTESEIICVDDNAHIVVYNSNDGDEDTIRLQTFEEDKEHKLSKNTYTKDGYVFQGWAETKADADNGFVKYRDEALITVDHDMTLYAVWANPALTLTAESADWSSGSITLCCTDADTSGEKHKYTLQCFHDDVSEWVDVGDDRAIDVSLSAYGKAHLTDGFFAERFDGIPPVKYRVRDKHNRVSAKCETRTKYGIFVAPGSYASNMVDGQGHAITPLPFMVGYASKFETLAISSGEMVDMNIHTLTGANAKYDMLDAKFKKVESTIKPGDICFLYFGTHGGVEINKTNPSLVLYDHFYTEQELARHVQTLNKVSEHNPKGTGVAVVGFVHACHSGGIATNGDGDGYCVPNAWCVNSALLSDSSAWVTATDDSKTIAFGEFFSEFLLAYGWEAGWAGDSSGGILSCKALADYTKGQVDALFDGIKMKNEYGHEIEVRTGISDKHHILRHIMMGHRGSHDGNRPVPTSPVIAVEGRSDSVIEITCDNVYNADAVVKFRKRGEGAYYEIWDGGRGSIRNGERSTISDLDVAGSGGDCPYFYQIRIFNGAGVGKSNEDSAWRIHNETLTIGFIYDVPNANYGGWQWSSAYGRSLTESGIWNAIGEKIDALDKRGYTLVGWFTERGGKGEKVSQGTIVYSDKTYYGYWTPMTQTWLDNHPNIVAASSGDIATAASMTAANGCQTVGECYALGIDPEDPNDDFKILDFKMEDGKPVITLNHTKDGSGNSFESRIKTLGKANLTDEDWVNVTDKDQSPYRFFKVTVDMP